MYALSVACDVYAMINASVGSQILGGTGMTMGGAALFVAVSLLRLMSAVERLKLRLPRVVASLL